ncbi:unnamed protein product [Coregonus sp. 'balchen']|nr:unnamed protein product [Coregonus sp. 'balchen']
MFSPEVKTLYNGILADRSTSVNLKIQVLKNLQTYLQEEDSRMQEADQHWKKLSKQEDLKEMGDISSGMSSSIMQLYLKQVLEAFFHTQSSVRHFALNVIALTLNQGLIHPVQCVPYLIAMGTDPEPSMRNKADQQLVEIDKKYTGFIHVQQAIMASRKGIIRGFRQDETTSALCAHLFSMVRGNRQHRRAFLISLLNLFDDSSSQEEPLFIMHHIDITLSVSGSNLLQTFKEGILLLLVLKQHLKNLYNFSDSKIQKYSPTESAKVYDKAVNRKTNVHFKPRQTIDFLSNNWANVVLTHDIKKRIVKQYLDFKTLMEHLDPDEEDEEGEAAQASANIRNKAINALLGGAGHGHLAPHKDRPQLARVIQKISTSYSVHWMSGSYSGPWADAKKRDGRKTVPWVDTIKESDIIYKKIALTSNHKLSNKVAQTLRSLYAAKEGTSS